MYAAINEALDRKDPNLRRPEQPGKEMQEMSDRLDKIVVMGGSFNPPTIAHLELMRAAVDAVNAGRGIFVPTSHTYVERKMKKAGCRYDTLSDELRLLMLESFCRKDSRFEISRIQMEKAASQKGYDFEMLQEIQQCYPEAELYFLTGSDKLYILPRWHRIDEFLAQFKILVARRGEDDLEEIKEERPYLAEHWDSFTVFSAPEKISSISSSAFREKFRKDDETARALLTEEVWRIMNEKRKLPAKSIANFHDAEYAFLSNFWEAPVTYGGLTYGSNEAAFQAQKCMTEEEKLPFTEARPSKSKGMGRKVKLRPDWEQVKVGIMEEIVRAKFTQNPELGRRLAATGDRILIEGNTWGDTCWGVDTRTGEGENHLGKILMKVRGEIQEGQEGSDKS